MDSKKTGIKNDQRVSDWLIHLIRELNHKGFTGSIRINFHKGQISKKIEKTSYLSE